VKRLRRLSLKAKLILITVAASLVSVIVACTLFIVYDIDNVRRAMKEDLRVVAEEIAINSTPALEFESLDSAREILGALRADPNIEMAVIYDRKGNSVDYRRADLGASTVPALSRTEGAYFEDGKLRIYGFVLREGKFLGTIFIQSDTEDLRDRLANDARVVVLVVVASLLAALLLLALIDDILDLSMIEAGTMEMRLETFDVKALVDDVESAIRPILARAANVLEVHCPADIGALHADVTRVRQALFNLLSNASRFTEKGTVVVHVTRDESPDGDWVTFRVTDTGKGSVFITSLPRRINQHKDDGVRISSTESGTAPRAAAG